MLNKTIEKTIVQMTDRMKNDFTIVNNILVLNVFLTDEDYYVLKHNGKRLGSKSFDGISVFEALNIRA